jgi:uncharacterized protein (TIGR02996 family)
MLSTSPARVSAPELLAFLASAKATPDDDTPRLVLADWLEEHGDPSLVARAEFVRRQCQAPRTPAERLRQAELLRPLAAEWLGPLYPLVRSWVARRGLLHLGAEADAFLAGAANLLLEAFAWVEGLNFVRLDDSQAARLARSPWLAHIAELELPLAGLGDAGARALAASPHVTGLRALFLRGNAIGDVGAAALAESPFLTNLSALSLAHNAVGPAGARALAASPHLGHLRVLNLEGNPLGTGATSLKAAAVSHRGLWLHLGTRPYRGRRG